jgi:eukaryotic-like serine/threonine-protein kinase
LSTIRVVTAEDSDPLVGGLIAERYRVESVLGAGGMGVVYLTEHVHMRKRFAVKVLHRELTHDEQVVARFEREAVAAGRIEHDNVVAARDFGRLEDGSFYLVLEYVVGQSLRKLIELGPVEPKRALEIARQITTALAAAHTAGVIHRDLKPDNVMLVDVPGRAELVKVLDFGIAKLTHGDTQAAAPLTQIGSVFGTPEYMSPELAMGETVDQRADFYALGIVLYEMISGRLPFEAAEPVATITQQMVAEPPPLPAEVRPEIAALILALMAKAPAERPQTAAEIVQRLDALLVHYEPPPRAETPSAGTVVGHSSPTRFGAQPAADPNLARANTVLAGQLPAAPARKPVDVARLLRMLTRSVPVHGKLVPLWLIGAGALLVTILSVGISAAVLGRIGARSASASSTGEPGPKSPLAARASRGDAAAISELEAQPQDDLDLEELIALGAGRLRLGRTRAAVQAYQAAIERDRAVAQRADVIRDVRRAADDPTASREALELVATSFGATAGDVLFAVREQAQAGSSVAARADQLLDAPNVQASASEPLRIALDLSRAKKCQEFKDLLPRATEHADARSLPYLEKLEKKRGCGRRKRHDCYRCLRTGSELADAVQRAGATAAPALDAPGTPATAATADDD